MAAGSIISCLDHPSLPRKLRFHNCSSTEGNCRGETVKRQEAFIKGKGDESLKHHVSAIIDDDFWQVVKEEKLQEGDFHVESSMSFGNSHWCRPTPRDEYRTMETDEDQSISPTPHRSTEEVAETVKRQEAIIKGKGDESLKHHVSVIIDYDFWQVVKEEKLQEGDFQVEGSMSFGSLHWCRPTPRDEYQTMETDEDLSISPTPHRSTEEADSTDDRHDPTSVDRRPPLTYRVRLPKIDVAHLNSICNPSQPSENIAYNFSQHSDDAPKSMQVNQTSERNLEEKEGKETKETEQDIHRIFNQIREKMKQMITLKKKSDSGKFAVPCLQKGIEFPCAMCDKGSSVSILPKVMAYHLGLKIEPSEDSFTFVDHSTKNSQGIIRDL
ncbi:hypothetical protein F2Q68_00004682 [Brassica cretica]|uniref:Uncharacterized protein n=1 Tax=Brassica cretica TaxID=69181 RepID=A0A8S9J5X6_BRACR|nr:hypothetical protein F2Q68_00004682 [Brassica cretica]